VRLGFEQGVRYRARLPVENPNDSSIIERLYQRSLDFFVGRRIQERHHRSGHDGKIATKRSEWGVNEDDA
jgi:hypothetical protein